MGAAMQANDRGINLGGGDSGGERRPGPGRVPPARPPQAPPRRSKLAEDLANGERVAARLVIYCVFIGGTLRFFSPGDYSVPSLLVHGMSGLAAIICVIGIGIMATLRS